MTAFKTCGFKHVGGEGVKDEEKCDRCVKCVI